MKTMIKKYRLWLILSFSNLLIASSSSQAQVETSKVFAQEINVSPDVTIYTTGPRALPINLHGTMTMDDTDYAFTIRGKSERPAIVLVKQLEVVTWDKNIVRQEVSIKVNTDTQSDFEKIESSLLVNLEEAPDKLVKVDCNMNIAIFRLRNGFFMQDKSWLELDNGTILYLNNLEISTKLYIPKTANFKLEGEYVDLKIGDLRGNLIANIDDGSIQAKDIERLELHAISSDINLGKVQTALINSRSCKISANHIGQLTIDDKPVRIIGDPHFDLDMDDANSSALNKYNLNRIENLEIISSENDHFTINSIDTMRVSNSIFSNYIINYLEAELNINAKSGDLTVVNIGQDFRFISINNEISTVKLGVNHLSNYLLAIHKDEQSKYRAPKGANLVAERSGWKNEYQKGDRQNTGNIEINCVKCKLIFE